MTFTEVRNEVVLNLEKHIGCPVVPSEQIAHQSEFPYCYYSVLAPRISDHAFGLHEVVEKPDGFIAIRSEPVKATMSFTFCSQDHDVDGGFVYGDDEALSLAEKGNGFFLLNAHCLRTDRGDIVVHQVGAVSNRSGFVVVDTIRRYGFDVQLSYIRTDEMPTETIEKAHFIGNPS